jgi:signal transduction histidine kinase
MKTPTPQRSPAATIASLEGEIAALRDERTRLAAELEETNRGVVALYAELEDQAERLRRADELKSRFLSRVSHELRTPINSIVALSRLLADRVDGDLSEGQSTQVGYIRSAADELSDLVNELLDLARIESGRVEVTAREFVLDTLLGALRGTLRPLARPDVELRFEPADDVPPLYTDEARLGQILRNFVSNALKFTSDGSVTVRNAFDPARGRVRIEVADTGVGIPPDELDRIFEEFVQVPGPHQIGVKGTGLGLSVARGLATLLGGEVGVTSAPGAGSTFWVEVPAIYRPPAAPATVDGDAVAAAHPTVLVIDDDPTARYLVRHQLAPAGFRLLEAENGADGIALATSERPDVIVLDLTMPDLDGLEVLSAIRAGPAPDVPVIAHSGRRLSPAERAGLERQTVRIVAKDEPARAIAAAIDETLRAARGRSEAGA